MEGILVQISPITSPKKQLLDEQMSGARNAVTHGKLKPSEAIIKFGVPCQTLRDRHTGRVVHGINPRPKPYLTKQDADHLILTAKLEYGKLKGR